MVGVRGFEPPTTGTPCRCATRLRYTPLSGLNLNMCIQETAAMIPQPPLRWNAKE